MHADVVICLKKCYGHDPWIGEARRVMQCS